MLYITWGYVFLFAECMSFFKVEVKIKPRSCVGPGLAVLIERSRLTAVHCFWNDAKIVFLL